MSCIIFHLQAQSKIICKRPSICFKNFPFPKMVRTQTIHKSKSIEGITDSHNRKESRYGKSTYQPASLTGSVQANLLWAPSSPQPSARLLCLSGEQRQKSCKCTVPTWRKTPEALHQLANPSWFPQRLIHKHRLSTSACSLERTWKLTFPLPFKKCLPKGTV